MLLIQVAFVVFVLKTAALAGFSSPWQLPQLAWCTQWQSLHTQSQTMATNTHTPYPRHIAKLSLFTFKQVSIDQNELIG